MTSILLPCPCGLLISSNPCSLVQMAACCPFHPGVNRLKATWSGLSLILVTNTQRHHCIRKGPPGTMGGSWMNATTPLYLH